ncbi:MAG TPA: cupin domain-containing protein, partial [Acidimicrobiales bacterium]|nr:cupin domain-containing protein [Acidimicrobiales bacterium]
KKFFMIFDDKSPLSADGSSPILKLDASEKRSHQYFVDPSGQLTVAMREPSDGRRALSPSSSYELAYLLAGHLEVSDDAGAHQVFGAGDAFLVPFGAATSWSSEAVRALCCTFTPRLSVVR